MLNPLPYLSVAEKGMPVLEEIIAQIGPTIQAEMKNGEQLIGDVQNALSILKTAFDNIKAAATAIPPAA